VFGTGIEEEEEVDRFEEEEEECCSGLGEIGRREPDPDGVVGLEDEAERVGRPVRGVEEVAGVVEASDWTWLVEVEVVFWRASKIRWTSA